MYISAYIRVKKMKIKVFFQDFFDRILEDIYPIREYGMFS